MTAPTLGLILAGGQARRMGGGDKAMLRVGGATILDRAIARLAPQCARLLINANGEPVRFAASGLPVVADDVTGFHGPLAGILAGLDWTAENAPGIEWVASVPGDCPFLPRDLIARLHAARAEAAVPLACAASGERYHPVIALWRVELAADLRRALVGEGLRKVETWAARHGVAVAHWPGTPVDPFFNVNTPDDLVQADRLAATREPSP